MTFLSHLHKNLQLNAEDISSYSAESKTELMQPKHSLFNATSPIHISDHEDAPANVETPPPSSAINFTETPSQSMYFFYYCKLNRLNLQIINEGKSNKSN